MLGQLDCVGGTGRTRLGRNRNTLRCLIDDDLVHAFALVEGQRGELAGAAARHQTVQPVVDQEIDVSAQATLIDLAIRCERGRYSGTSPGGGPLPL